MNLPRHLHSSIGLAASLGPFRRRPTLPLFARRASCSAAPPNGAASDGPPASSTSKKVSLCLERAIGGRSGVDSALWETGAFYAQVYPDLPFASSWTELLAKLLDRSGGGTSLASSSAAAAVPSSPPQQLCFSSGGKGLTVRTVGAQCRSRSELRRCMQLACSPVATGGGGADALLLLSGGHPARTLPFTNSLLQDSFGMLRDAREMRKSGDLPAATQLWAVENPSKAPVGRLQRKVEAGAEVVLTQPFFVRSRCERWCSETQRTGLSDSVKVMAGVPLASSAGNLDFWLKLCGLGGTPEAEAVLNSFPRAGPDSSGKEVFEAAVRTWNEDFIRWTLALPGVSGLHVMPLTNAARAMTLSFLDEGVLPAA